MTNESQGCGCGLLQMGNDYKIGEMQIAQD